MENLKIIVRQCAAAGRYTEQRKQEDACNETRALRYMDAIKARVTNYWNQRAEGFASQRLREWASEKHGLWMEELEKYIPMDTPLEILDVGTGTGFFAMLLSSRGHRVTGIDLSGNMIDEARKTSAHLGLPANFAVMDGENPDFASGKFDVIVTRNLTWALPNLGRAYRNWRSLLNPGGILLNFDADYCREDTGKPLPENHAHKQIGTDLMQEYEHLKEELRPSQQPRPTWDVELLKAAGFGQIRVDTAVWQRIYPNVDEFYNPTPIFLIAARA